MSFFYASTVCIGEIEVIENDLMIWASTVETCVSGVVLVSSLGAFRRSFVSWSQDKG